MGSVFCTTSTDPDLLAENKRILKSSTVVSSVKENDSHLETHNYEFPFDPIIKGRGLKSHALENRKDSFIPNSWVPKLDLSSDANEKQRRKTLNELTYSLTGGKISPAISRKDTESIFGAFMANKSSFTFSLRTLSLQTMTSPTSSYAPPPMTKVRPRLYVGTLDDANNEKELRAKGITHILSLIGHKSSVKWVKHKHKPMNDYGKTDLKGVLKEVLVFMEEGQKEGNSLLVHCQSGQNRSATVVIAFLMMSCQKTLFLSHKELKNLRPVVQINVEYAKQLLELEKELFKENSLPSNWMERGSFDHTKLEVKYRYENMTVTQHGRLYPQSVIPNGSW